MLLNLFTTKNDDCKLNLLKILYNFDKQVAY